jgi:hypothetical protein
LKYFVVGVNEYYTSKKCPVCEDFVGHVDDIRRFYCQNCEAYMHRDIMAGPNMCNAIKGHLLHQKRPRYLQPVDNEGNYPWEEEEEVNSESVVAEPSPKMTMEDEKSKCESVVTEPGPEVSMEEREEESTVYRLSVKRTASNEDQDEGSSEKAQKRAT